MIKIRKWFVEKYFKNYFHVELEEKNISATPVYNRTGHLSQKHALCWEDSWVVRSMDCSLRGRKFSFQHPY